MKKLSPENRLRLQTLIIVPIVMGAIIYIGYTCRNMEVPYTRGYAVIPNQIETYQMGRDYTAPDTLLGGGEITLKEVGR